MGSTHVVEQLSFSMFPSILTFDVDLIWGPVLFFGGPNELLLWLGFGLTTFLGSTYLFEQVSFSMFLSILTFDYDLVLG